MLTLASPHNAHLAALDARTVDVPNLTSAVRSLTGTETESAG